MSFDQNFFGFIKFSANNSILDEIVWIILSLYCWNIDNHGGVMDVNWIMDSYPWKHVRKFHQFEKKFGKNIRFSYMIQLLKLWKPMFCNLLSNACKIIATLTFLKSSLTSNEIKNSSTLANFPDAQKPISRLLKYLKKKSASVLTLMIRWFSGVV